MSRDTYQKPYIIENVPGSPLKNYIILCGMMFELPLFRHRLFEMNFLCLQPGHTHKGWKTRRNGDKPDNGERGEGEVWTLSGRFAGAARARRELSLEWMTRDEMREAIPPAYTEYIGKYLMEVVMAEKKKQVDPTAIL